VTSEERRRRTHDLRGQIVALRGQIADFEREIADFERELKELEDACSHKWSAPEYKPIVIKGYTIPADPPGIMGVDRIGYDRYVPDLVAPQWVRTCSICGKVGATTNFDEQMVSNRAPRF
jgi:hypothetical protein